MEEQEFTGYVREYTDAVYRVGLPRLQKPGGLPGHCAERVPAAVPGQPHL